MVVAPAGEKERARREREDMRGRGGGDLISNFGVTEPRKWV